MSDVGCRQAGSGSTRNGGWGLALPCLGLRWDAVRGGVCVRGVGCSLLCMHSAVSTVARVASRVAKTERSGEDDDDDEGGREGRVRTR